MGVGLQLEEPELAASNSWFDGPCLLITKRSGNKPYIDLDADRGKLTVHVQLVGHVTLSPKEENDPTLIGRVKKSDAREMQSFYQHYYKKYIQALQNAADKADRFKLLYMRFGIPEVFLGQRITRRKRMTMSLTGFKQCLGFRDVWAFLLTCKVSYCSLYDQG